MSKYLFSARDVLLVNPEDAKAKKLSGPTLYMVEKNRHGAKGLWRHRTV